MPAMDSRRIADVLAGAARLAFERMRLDPMNDDPETLKQNVSAFSDELVLHFLASLDEIDAAEALPIELQKPAVDAFVDANLALAPLTIAARRSGLLPDRDWMAPYRAMLRSEGLARAMLNIPQKNRFDDEKLAYDSPTQLSTGMSNETALLALGSQIAAIQAILKPVGPLFSEASRAYVEKVAGAKGHDDENVSYYQNVTAAFIALCGDRPVNKYKEADLQNFVNQLAYLPPNFTKVVDGERQTRPEFTEVKVFIEENKRKNGRGLALGTIMDNYLGRARTIISAACREAEIRCPTEHTKIIRPNRAARRKAKRPLDHDAMSIVIAAGVASGLLADALLPALGLLTGRRISLLAFLRRESIIRVNGVWMVFPDSHHEVNGEWVTVPYKTEDSLQGYVLNPLFEEIGFTEWASRGPGFVFEQLMSAKDPGDAAQKRMSRLFQNNGLDSGMATFHLLRHSKIGHDRSVAVPARLIRVQAGHELGDVHDAIYGGLQPGELRQMRDVPLPEGIDWSVLKQIDFERFAKKRPTGGRPQGAIGKRPSPARSN